jgi:hypothetical protein
MNDARRDFLQAMAKTLADQGKLIEAGWFSLQAIAIPADAPPVQVKEMRKAFMAGAQHLFASIVDIMDPEEEPTEADLRRMDLIDAELRAYVEELKEDPAFRRGLSG